MSTDLRPLHGGCQCGRNRYVIAMPQGGAGEALVHFNTEPVHQVSLGSPLAAFIRVPLTWYHSTTYSFFPDETHTLIRRVYTHPSQQHAKRHFCGFCGTPLSYWSEEPHTEAGFINLTLGSLMGQDLRDLEDMGLIPDEPVEGGKVDPVHAAGSAGTAPPRGHPTDATTQPRKGIPWFDGLVEGSRLGSLRRSHVIQRDGRVEVEWEVIEYVDDGHSSRDVDMVAATPTKRKLAARDDPDIL